MKRLAVLLLAAVAGATAAQMTPQQATDAAKAYGKPRNATIPSTLTPANAGNIVPNYNTAPPESTLFGGGKGSLIGPGNARVADCAGRENDPDPKVRDSCRAVNDVSHLANNPPPFTLSTSDPLIVNSRNTRNNPTGVLGPNMPNGNYNGCVTETKKTGPTFDEEVCNIYAVEVLDSCTYGPEIVTDPDYLYKCLELQKTQSQATCTIGRVVTVNADSNFICNESPKKLENLSCDKVLTIEGDPSCNLGQFYTAFAQDPGGLGQDACDGGDNIWLSYQCTENAPPALIIQTNVKNAPNFVFSVNGAGFDETHQFSNCRGRWYGNTVCNGTNCRTSMIMEISYAGNGVCVQWDPWDPTVCIQYDIAWIYSGALGKVFDYNTFTLNNLRDVWVNNCTALEARQ